MIYAPELRHILAPTFSLKIEQSGLYHTFPKEKVLKN